MYFVTRAENPQQVIRPDTIATIGCVRQAVRQEEDPQRVLAG